MRATWVVVAVEPGAVVALQQQHGVEDGQDPVTTAVEVDVE